MAKKFSQGNLELTFTIHEQSPIHYQNVQLLQTVLVED
jgi:hypothetical protein